MTQLEFIIDVLPNLLIGFPALRPGGLVLSIGLAASAIGVGCFAALLLGVLHTSERRLVRWPVVAFVEAARGLPLVFLMIVIRSLGTQEIVGVDFSARSAAWLALLLYATSYQTIIVSAGLRNVPLTEREAARASGFSRWQAVRLVEFPQGIRMVMPALTGHAISLFKDTSVVLVLGVAELMTVTKLTASAGNERFFLALYVTAGALYFGVAFLLSRIARRFEQRAPALRLRWLALES